MNPRPGAEKPAAKSAVPRTGRAAARAPRLSVSKEGKVPATTTSGDKHAGTVSKDTALRLFRSMKMTRETEDRLERKLYRQGKIVGGCYVGRGQEAITTGCVGALEKEDVIFPSHRDMAR